MAKRARKKLSQSSVPADALASMMNGAVVKSEAAPVQPSPETGKEKAVEKTIETKKEAPVSKKREEKKEESRTKPVSVQPASEKPEKKQTASPGKQAKEKAVQKSSSATGGAVLKPAGKPKEEMPAVVSGKQAEIPPQPVAAKPTVSQTQEVVKPAVESPKKKPEKKAAKALGPDAAELRVQMEETCTLIIRLIASLRRTEERADEERTSRAMHTTIYELEDMLTVLGIEPYTENDTRVNIHTQTVILRVPCDDPAKHLQIHSSARPGYRNMYTQEIIEKEQVRIWYCENK